MHACTCRDRAACATTHAYPLVGLADFMQKSSAILVNGARKSFRPLSMRSVQCRFTPWSAILYPTRIMCWNLFGFLAVLSSYHYVRTPVTVPITPCDPLSHVHASAVTLAVRHHDTIALVVGVATHDSRFVRRADFTQKSSVISDQWRAQIFSSLAR